MENSFTATITVSKNAEHVFRSICDTRGWWTGEFTGDAKALGSEFTYKYKDMHSSIQKVTTFEPNKKIVWEVTDATISFLKDKHEWVGTNIIFEIEENGDETTIKFTHDGVTPNSECWEACSSGWSGLIKENLKNFIETGNIQGDVFDK